MFKTAEAVAIGHPDKVCDQISDAILDACLEEDPFTRSAIEVMGGHGVVAISGELTTRAEINPREIAKVVCEGCGYGEPLDIKVNISRQSLEIKRGVDNEGAGDQGVVVGYATCETEEFMPLEVMLSRKIVKAMGTRDGKAQVTIKDGKISSFLTSVCGIMSKKKEEEFVRKVKDIVSPYTEERNKLNDIWTRNPNGEWNIGGFNADTGLTGRKIIIDNYGPNVPVGGGAFSGKDATKVDRSGAYMARKIAVDYLKKHGAKQVTVWLAYAIGLAEPVMSVIEMDGRQNNVFGYDLRPQAIIEYLDLRKPQFQETAKYGHFGNGHRWDKN